MDAKLAETAQRCMSAAYDGTLDFASIVRTLVEAGFEGYEVDYRKSTATYYLPSGGSVEIETPKTAGAIARAFDADLVAAAVREAQANAPGYTYTGFCTKVKTAGCAGYMVSFSGKRVLYFGRTAETHVELFPR